MVDSSDSLRAERDFDESKERDWLGYWFRRSFGKTEFTYKEIMDGGRAFRLEWEKLMTLFFEYMWDQELGQRRQIQTRKTDAKQTAIEWVGGKYDIILEAFSLGADLTAESIEFDTKKNRAGVRR